MRFERIRARAFGRLEEFDTGKEPLASLIVVVGPNESGKTTFFHMLGSLIYGLYPASRDQHPYAPWSGRDLDVEADLRLDDDVLWSVRRRLLASPTGHITRGDHEESLRNQTLSCTTHVTREVFHQVFALTLAEVATLESEAWSEIQDRLIGAMGARDLVPARSAAGVLEVEARGLWRPDRRGKQEIRELRDRIHRASTRRRQALDTDRLLRGSVKKLQRTREELKEAKLLREQQRLLIERTTTLLPVRKLLDRATELDIEAGPTQELDAIPTDPVGTHGRLVTEVARLQSRLGRACADAETPRERAARFGSAEERMLGARADIEDLVIEVAGLKPAGTRLGALEREIQDRRRRADSSLNELFARDLTESEERVLRRIVPRELHDRVRNAARARDRQREQEVRSTLRQAAPRPSARTLVVGAASGLAAAALLLPGSEEAWPRVIGALLALVSAVFLARWWTIREAFERGERSGPSDSATVGAGGASQGVAGDAGGVESAVLELRQLLADLPIRDDVVEEAGPELSVTVARLQELLDELDARTVEAERSREAFDRAHERIATTGRGLGIDLPLDDSVAVHVLESKLREAEKVEEASKSAHRELESLDRAQDDLRSELDTRTAELRSLEEALRRLGDDDVAAGLETAERRRRARVRAEQIREDLTRSHPDLDELVARLDELGNSDGRPFGDDELATARIALEDQTDRIEELTGRLKELEHECGRAEEQITADQIDGEIEAFEAELAHLKAEHDRKLVFAHLIREADRRFREEHQPDVVRKASKYLKTITSGRYDRITVGEAGDFYVRGPGAGGAVEASSLSTGAQQQLYLAIRLAVMSHLDEGRERLPAFVDETFVNWDDSRRARGFELLHELSRTRQVFVMTCHARWADELAEHGAQRIDLK